jgi:putative ABC transport system permease protein
MFQNSLLVAIRHIRKNKKYSVISIIGLALAVGCFTLPFVVKNFNESIDMFHKNGKRIYYVESRIGKSGGGRLWGITPAPLGPALKDDFPQVEDYVRVNRGTAVVRSGDKIFKDRMYFTDSKFLDFFTFPLICGEKTALEQSNSIIITKEAAEKYFGRADPLEKTVLISNEKDFKELFMVKAVVSTPSEASSLQFDILIPIKKLQAWEGSVLREWGKWVHTFILLKNRQDITALKNHTMIGYIKQQNTVEKSWPIQSLLFENLYELSQNTPQVNRDLGMAGFPPATMVGLWGFGIIMLLLACFNFINIGIVTGTRRLTEIGIRKVLGSNRSKLIVQFIGEHILICLLAIVLGGIFARTVILPSYTNMFTAPLKMDFFQSFDIWIFYGLTFLITVFGSGGYPALYVSRFRPVDILKKSHKVGGGSKISNIFLIFQFILAFIIIGTSLIFIQNAIYQKNLDWGYNQEQVVNVVLKDKNQFEVYKNKIAQNPDIIGISGTEHHIGRSWTMETVKYHEQEYAMNSFAVGPDYLKTIQVHFKEGRNFKREFATDSSAIIVNDSFVSTMGWKNPVGQNVKINNNNFTLIGVIEDFYNQPFTEPVKPVLFRLCDKENFRYLCIRARADKVIKTAAFLEKSWKQLFPDKLYEGFYQDEIWADFFRINAGVCKLSCFVGLIALLISCMGLFGLISVNIVRRLKEICIRKVFGASMQNIVRLLSKNLAKILIISSLIAVPLCYFFTVSMMDSYFSTHSPITATPFLLALAILTITSISTVLSHIIKAANINIADTLREE